MFLSSLTGVKVREYEAKEFCESMACPKLAPDRRGDGTTFICTEKDCVYSAKVFHRWLLQNGFFIFKPVEEVCDDPKERRINDQS
ncbi:MAG: hypothetical protein AB7C95_00775 [Synergistaceae bacterium]